jgi:replication factor C subunit 3/5
MLWVDKHRPKTLDKLVVNRKHGQQLKKLVSAGDCPHLLFYGPSGAGKKTLCLATLRDLFGPGVEKLKTEHKTWQIKLPSRKIEVELATVSSNYHLELNPSEAGRKDVHVVQEVIKEMAKTKSSTSMFQQDAASSLAAAAAATTSQQQAASGSGSTPGSSKASATYKVLLINEVDRLSRHAQHALRRTMEKYSKQCRLVMTCTNLSKVIDPVQSRCVCVRVKAPKEDEMVEVVKEVAKKEHLDLPEKLGKTIASKSNRSLRRALLMLETCRVEKYPFGEDDGVQQPEWERFLEEIAKDILKEQSPKMLFQVRGKLYELLINNIPPELIFQQLVAQLLGKCATDQLKTSCVATAAAFEHRMQLGSKPIFHLEAFVSKFMATYKEFLINF